MLGPSPYKLAVSGQDKATEFFGDYRPDEHQTLVVDDFYCNWRYTTFLQVCDRYPTEVHTKGGFVQLLIRHAIFTTNLDPVKWYPKILADGNRSNSFKRRIHNIIEFTAEFYVVKKGNLPWPVPFLRPATAFDLLNPQNSQLHLQDQAESERFQFLGDGLPAYDQAALANRAAWMAAHRAPH